jgi:flagellar biosynthesis protein FliR
MVLGRFFLSHVFHVRDIPFVYRTGLILLLAVAVINSAKPVQAMIITRCDLRKFFFSISLPTLLIGVGISLTLTHFQGAMGTAVTKFPVYGFFLTASSWFVSISSKAEKNPLERERRYFEPPSSELG